MIWSCWGFALSSSPWNEQQGDALTPTEFAKFGIKLYLFTIITVKNVFFCYFQFLRKHPCKKSAANYDRIHDVPEVPATDAIPIVMITYMTRILQKSQKWLTRLSKENAKEVVTMTWATCSRSQGEEWLQDRESWGTSRWQRCKWRYSQSRPKQDSCLWSKFNHGDQGIISHCTHYQSLFSSTGSSAARAKELKV